MVAWGLTSLIHSQNTALHQFLDDLLGQAMSKEHCAKLKDLVLLLCKELGCLLNQEKSELISQLVFAFVSIHFDLISCPSHPQELDQGHPSSPISQPSFIPSCCPVTLHLGILQGQSCLIPLGRLHIHPLQWNLSQFWD